MSADALLVAAFRRALSRLDPERLVRESLARTPFPAGAPLEVAALGKGGARMAAGVADRPVRRALVVTTPEEALRGHGTLPAGWAIRAGDHPLPGRRSFQAGRELAAFFAHAPAEPLLALVSGGGSSLAEVPRPPLLEGDVSRLAEAIFAAGRPIREMNAVRRRLSWLKGGGLLRLRHGGVRTLLVSDVPSGTPAIVSSGPTLPPPGDEPDVSDLLARLPDLAGLDAGGRARLAAALAAPVSGIDLPPNSFELLASPEDLARFLAEELGDSGIPVEIVAENLDAPADEFARRLAGEATGEGRAPRAVVLGGEPTLAVPPGAPAGGRAAHVALSTALRLAELGSDREVAILAAASDGVDGTGDSGGALLSPALVAAIAADPGPARRALDELAATPFLGAAGALLPGAETGANLRDVFVVAPGALL